MTDLQKLRSDASGITFAEPSDPDNTVRFKQTASLKSLNGHSVKNQQTEIIANDLADILVGTETVQEALSVRIKVSGSHFAKERKRTLLLAIASKLGQWETEGVFEGFEPQTPPIDAVVE
jgi:hypothetical protein